MDTTNPLGMERHTLGDGDDGPFVLPPQQATIRRRQYFERGQRILAAYTSIVVYSEKGRAVVESQKKQGNITPTTPIRLGISGFQLQTTPRRLEQMFVGAGAEITRQFLVAVYGNFEALLTDHVLAAFAATGDNDVEQATLRIMRGHWRGKIDRISQKFALGLGTNQLRKSYEHIEMEGLGRRFDDPVEFLQAVADLRHRVVHSSGRVDQALLLEYPESKLQPGELIVVPLDLPLALWFFFVPISEELDRVFAERFGWPREQVRPETVS